MTVTEKSYERDAAKLIPLFEQWIAEQSASRFVDLQFYEWGSTAYAGPLTGEALDLLCVTADAKAMCEWADERSGRKCTLLQALAAAEALGLKTPNQGPPVPAEVLGRYRLVRAPIGNA